MTRHVCKRTCWHLIAKSKGVDIHTNYRFSFIGQAWDFIKEMKDNPLIDEIIWTIHKESGEVYDEPVHLKRKNGEWLKSDIEDWKDNYFGLK